ncbi:MAG TPA: class I SAM-dependent methyltransferase [Candidatus Binataceae bacterium]|nr:class I SAM-dependent methyltransferase [Candidatus Binataceae bacterium]
MGRFASTIPFYARYREPYPPEFFSTLAARLGLTGKERLLDLGCGPAPLALGFARFVGSCTGVDPEPGMIAAAHEEAACAGVALKLREATVESLPESIGKFDIVTIGRALHWMEPRKTRSVLEHLVSESGAVLLCGASPAKTSANAWLAAYDQVRKQWSRPGEGPRYSVDVEQWFSGSRFRLVDRIAVPSIHRVTVEELIGRALSKSTTSPQLLGERRTRFEEAIAQALRPFAPDGNLVEEIEAAARIFQ